MVYNCWILFVSILIYGFHLSSLEDPYVRFAVSFLPSSVLFCLCMILLSRYFWLHNINQELFSYLLFPWRGWRELVLIFRRFFIFLSFWVKSPVKWAKPEDYIWEIFEEYFPWIQGSRLVILFSQHCRNVVPLPSDLHVFSQKPTVTWIVFPLKLISFFLISKPSPLVFKSDDYKSWCGFLWIYTVGLLLASSICRFMYFTKWEIVSHYFLEQCLSLSLFLL